MNEIAQGFTKGISRGTTRSESYDPEVFYTLQNARVLQSGNIGEVVRINGYSELVTTYADIDTLYDIIKFRSHVIVFYKTTTTNGSDTQFKIFIYSDDGTQVNSFSYFAEPSPDKGELKQFDDTIFIAPHNKIVYLYNGTYYLKDFISTPPSIVSTTTESLSLTKAKVDVTISNTVSNFAGSKAKGLITVLRNTVPTGVEDTIKVSIGGSESSAITVKSTYSKDKIAELITTEINTTFSTNWTATQNGNVVTVERNQIGDVHNGIAISISTSSYIKNDQEETGRTPGQISNPLDEGSVDRTNFAEDLSLAIITTNTFGGIDAQTTFGGVVPVLSNGIEGRPFTITGSDTTTDVATKLQSSLNSETSITERYTISRTTNVVTVEAKKTGTQYNTDFILINQTGRDRELELPSDFYSVAQTEADVAEATGTLEPDTPYWYKARFKYIDGHTTQTCSPVLQFSDSDNRYIEVVFDVNETDLDGTNLPNLQIFRKKEGEEFYLIKEINLDNETVTSNQFTFTDEGFSKKELLDETINIWTESHKTQEVIENRNVKANITFFDENYSIADADFTFSSTTDDTNQDVIPFKSRVELYARPQFTDGTLGYFTELDTLGVSSKNQKIQVVQNNVISGTDKTIKELRFYGKYLPYSQEENLRFNTPEIQTPNLQSIEDPKLFPLRTKVLFGYKYLTVIENGGNKNVFVTTAGWDKDIDKTSKYFRFVGVVRETGTIRSGIFEEADGRIKANIHGNVQSYIPIATYDQTTIYKLESLEALKEAVSTGELYTRINKSRIDSLSSVVDDDDIIGLKTKVIGIDDKSEGKRTIDIYVDEIDAGITTFESKFLFPTEDSRIYLVLEESVLDEIDNNNLNYYDFIKRGTQARNSGSKLGLNLDIIGNLSFDIINFQLESEAEESDGTGDFDLTDTRDIVSNDGIYKEVNYEEAKYYLINKDIETENAVIYLGKKNNEASTVTLDTTGFRYKLRTLLTYSILSSYNIYDQTVFESDFNFDKTELSNQIIWSSPLLTNNYFAGGRNFAVENFYNIPTENGDIVKLISLNGSLFVFCERGIARLLIGETLTQQKGGQVYVDSSNFITKNIWIFENAPEIKEKSIVKHEGYIYFTDGNDVYRISEGIENISQGILSLDETVDYVGSVVKKYDEYRITDTSSDETFVFNTKYGQWYGPFTYSPQKTVEINNKIISYVDRVVQEDVGNTFSGTSYTTIIQNMANDTKVGTVDKTYRKFYLDLDGDTEDVNPTVDVTTRISDTTFKYGKDFNSMTSKAIDGWDVTNGVPVVGYRNGWYQIGVDSSEGNTKKIYWDIESTNQNFSLKGLVTAYMLRRRR